MPLLQVFYSLTFPLDSLPTSTSSFQCRSVMLPWLFIDPSCTNFDSGLISHEHGLSSNQTDSASRYICFLLCMCFHVINYNHQRPSNLIALLYQLVQMYTSLIINPFIIYILLSNFLFIFVIWFLRIHDLIAEMGFESDVYIGTSLVEMYCKVGDLISAKQVFDKMPMKDIVTWNTMVSGLAQNGCPGEALRLFCNMHLSCVEIDHVSLYSLIPAVSKVENNDVCRCLHGLVIKKGFTFVFSSGLIDMYCKCADLYAAECVFEEVLSKDDSSWGTMMAAYAHNGSFEEVLKLFDLMRNYDVRMNKVAAASALQAAANVGDSETGTAIHEYAVQHGIMSDVSVATSLMNMYSKCGELEIAEKLFINIKHRDVVSWYAIIASFEKAGHHYDALSLFRDMMRTHVKPNFVTLSSVLPTFNGRMITFLILF